MQQNTKYIMNYYFQKSHNFNCKYKAEERQTYLLWKTFSFKILHLFIIYGSKTLLGKHSHILNNDDFQMFTIKTYSGLSHYHCCAQ